MFDQCPKSLAWNLRILQVNKTIMKKGMEPLNVDANNRSRVELCMQLASFRLHSCTILSSFLKRSKRKKDDKIW